MLIYLCKFLSSSTMRPKLSLFILLSCFFMHASDTRHLGLTNYKDFHKTKLSHKRIEEKLRRFGLNLSSNPRGTIDCSKMILSTSAIISKSNEAQLALCKMSKGNRGANYSGNEDGKAHLHKTLQNARKPKGSRWRQLNNVKEKVLHSSLFTEEDLFETDYQPPHRKSPIHNK